MHNIWINNGWTSSIYGSIFKFFSLSYPYNIPCIQYPQKQSTLYNYISVTDNEAYFLIWFVKQESRHKFIRIFCAFTTHSCFFFLNGDLYFLCHIQIC